MPEWLEVVVRTLFAVVVLFLLTKLLGKRQVSQLSFFEYITGITIGSLAAYISMDTDRYWHLGLIALVVWVACSLGIEYLQTKSKKAKILLISRPLFLLRTVKYLRIISKRNF